MGRPIHVAIGDRFGRLIFRGELPPRNNRRRGLFLCVCGAEREIAVHDVRSGHTTSCGCVLREVIRRARTHGATRGRAVPREYEAWKAMKRRCYGAGTINYHDYGGRGIRVCDRWLHDFAAFLADVGPKPSKAHSLDRINNNGNYEPANCRWATRSEQRRNTRQGLHLVTLGGETRPIVDWAAVSGVPEESISARLRNGWDAQRAIFQPCKSKSPVQEGV